MLLTIIFLAACSVVHEEVVEMEIERKEDSFGILEFTHKKDVEVNVDGIDFNVRKISLIPINEHSEKGYIGLDVEITNYKENDILYPVQNTRVELNSKRYTLDIDGIKEVIGTEEGDLLEYKQVDYEMRGLPLSEGERGRYMLLWEVSDNELEMKEIMGIEDISVRLVGLKGKDGVRLNYKLDRIEGKGIEDEEYIN